MYPPVSPRDLDRQRAHGIVRSHGHGTTSFQTLGRGLSYRFFREDAYVAFADTGSAWVAAGAPVCPPAQMDDTVRAFVGSAREAGRRARFFGVPSDLGAGFLRHTRVGEEPLWDPAGWPDILRDVRSLREQLRRARAKGVRARPVEPTRLGSGPVTDLARRWLATRRMAPMGFLVQLDPLRFSSDRLYIAAERGDALVGLLVASPIHARRGWLVEHVLRDPSAPNGTSELLVDALMRQAARQGDVLVSLGHAPLAGPINRPLRLARRLGRVLYNFEGLERFKRKLRPHHVEPLYLAYPAPERGVVAVFDALDAFAPGGMARFGARTLGRMLRRLLPGRPSGPPRLPGP
jgi:phosphatidylglycerol lysyltransferase